MKWAFWIESWEGMAVVMVVGIGIADIMEVAITVVVVTAFRPVEVIAIPLLRLAMEFRAPHVGLLMHQERNFVTNAAPH